MAKPRAYVCDLPGWGADGRAARSSGPGSGSTGRDEEAFRRQAEFSSKQPKEGSPETPGRVDPDRSFTRRFEADEIRLPDGREIEVWRFDDEPPTRRGRLLSPLIRCRQGEIVHVTIEGLGKGPHTIHHHGIEPDPFNDGVGHTSFEVSGHYTYQWRPAQAGSYLYHCHVNTTLHFHMGLVGPLIVDPPDGPGRAFEGGPAYDVEAFWVAHDVDPAFHELGHAAGLDGEDVGLNVYRPQFFLINGVFHPETRAAPEVAIEAAVGQTILIRTLDASFFPARFDFGGLEAEVAASDGRPFRDAQGRFASFRARSLLQATAERYDCILRPDRPGTFVARVEFIHWISGEVVGVAETTIVVGGDPARPGRRPARRRRTRCSRLRSRRARRACLRRRRLRRHRARSRRARSRR